MKVLNYNTSDKPYYKFNNTYYLQDDFGNMGRLSFDDERLTIVRLITIFKFHPNTPKIKRRKEIFPSTIISIKKKGEVKIDIEEIKKFKTAKIVTIKNDDDNYYMADSFHLPLFIEMLLKTEVKFMYEPKEYLDKIALEENHKEPLFTPKPRNYDRSENSGRTRRNYRYKR